MDDPSPQLGETPDLDTPVGGFTNRELKAELVNLANWQQVPSLTDEARQLLKDRLDEARAEATIRGLIPS